MNKIDDLNKYLSHAIAHYWLTRQKQSKKQVTSGRSDQGARSAVTGGAQMDGFIGLITDLIIEAGADKLNIFHDKYLELPGFFRPTKKWDLLLVKDNQLILALEAKSQVGPSFGNNFNNRTEEAIGSALDLWTAYREGAYNKTIKPWLGYLFLLEDCQESRKPVSAEEPHFKVLAEFVDASYSKRYELFCRKLVRERLYNVATFIKSDEAAGQKGRYSEPAKDLTFDIFVRSLIGQVSAFGVPKI
ncbi:MAG: PaeR7I family type II restriction endonuclease [Deltaproteobacteria bacterium]|nr:PaeR7I family type II restriction endonuclease [Deltaproteobacteria bacterium]